jgi:hypothetical protein
VYNYFHLGTSVMEEAFSRDHLNIECLIQNRLRINNVEIIIVARGSK